MAQALVGAVDDPRIESGLRRQLDGFERRLAVGEGRVGWKIALNSPAVQQRLELRGPLLGYLTSASAHAAGGPLALSAGEGAHLVEVEVALALDRDLPAGASMRACRDAIGAAAPALEILHFGGGLRPLEEILADNVYHERVVFGASSSAASLPGADDLALALRVNGGQAVALDPSLVVGELPEIAGFVADLLAGFGHALRAGDRILCGSLNPPVVIHAGDRIEAELSPLGSLALQLA